MKNRLSLFAAVPALLCMGAASAQYSTPYRNVDNPDRFPFQVSRPIGVAVGTHNLVANFPLTAGKRVVLEYVSLGCRSASPSDTYPDAFISASVAPASAGDAYQTVTMALPNLTRGGQAYFAEVPWASAGPATLYADAPAGFTVSVEHTDVGVPADCVVTITGHTVAP